MPPLFVFLFGAVAGAVARPYVKSARSTVGSYIGGGDTVSALREDIQDLKAELTELKRQQAA